jgi:tetratricopeptide (TPR) repeat protein
LTWLTLSFSALAAESGMFSGTADVMKEAQHLVQQRKFADAYALMQPLESEQAGNPVFDYLFGLSAVNSGHPDRATLALERAQATLPEFGETRLWLGLAYYLSGDVFRAKKLFSAMLSEPDLSPQSKATADKYLAAIKQQEDEKILEEQRAYRSYVVGNLELGVGHDSNITVASSNIGIATSSGLSGRFTQMNGDVEVRKPLSGAGSYGFLAADSSNRDYAGHTFMNSSTNTVRGGLNWRSGMDTYRIRVSHQEYRQQGTAVSQGVTADSTQNALFGSARLAMGQYDYLGVSLQYNTPRYATRPRQDTNQVVMDANYTHTFRNEGSPTIYVAFSQERDRALRESVPLSRAVPTTDVSRDTNVVTLYSQYSVVENTDVTAMWMTRQRNDSKPYARSATVMYGKDDMRVMMLGVNWRPGKNWVVKPQFMRVRNISEVAGYAFEKNEYSVSIKREFR